MKPLSELIGAPIIILMFAGLMLLMPGLLLMAGLGLGLVGVVWLIAALAWYGSRRPAAAAIAQWEQALTGARKGKCPGCRKQVVVRTPPPGQADLCPSCMQPV